MLKQHDSQRYIFKIHTSRLARSRWDINLPLEQARQNDEVISIGDSQMLRWIDELNGVSSTKDEVRQVKSEIKAIKARPHSVQNRNAIRRLYDRLNELLFKPDYVHLVIDKPSDLKRACKGFKVNGIKYTRLVGTNGGVKESTIVFVNEKLAPVLRERINNGRANLPQIPAKLEAYRALTCSGSTPVSMPNGILVVPDCETTFKENVIMLNDEGVGEPEMSCIDGYDVTLDESDGYGLMCPALAERWSNELGLDYVVSGLVTRFSWEKGMAFCFDFHAFADEVAHQRIVKDAWGHDVDITNVELILTTSMLKLWNCYDGIDQYLENCAKNNYVFSVTKTSPKALENRRELNYQFLQSYDLSDEQIDELIAPTLNEIRGVVHGDYRQALVFLLGKDLNDGNVERRGDGFAQAMMIDPDVYNDPFVRKKIFQLIERRITDAKIGCVSVHGNFSIVCGDPYALCQHIFGLPVTGLLKAGEIYNKYWSDNGAQSVACFRAPMTCHNNIRRMRIASGDDIAYWYQHITTCTLINAWDTTAQALNGMDKDGDLIFITDNRVLVDNLRDTPTIFCVQRKAEKIDVTEDDLVKSNIAGFGDDIGKTTNWITSMFDVQAQFPKDSEEYKTLEYRIMCGQLFQQNAIDKVKGIVCKPMPRTWYDFKSNALPADPSETDIQRRQFYLSILAEKKPYFMRYIYPALMTQYNAYIKNTGIKCVRLFRIPIDTLLGMSEAELTDDQRQFIRYYHMRMPVSTNDCVVNRICRKFEDAFNGVLRAKIDDAFDPSKFKSGQDCPQRRYNTILKLYKQYTDIAGSYRQKRRASLSRNAESDSEIIARANLVSWFRSECYAVCSNEKELCDAVIDVCYSREGSKQFAWDVCGETMIRNLLEKNDFMISYPEWCEDGEFSYGGHMFTMKTKRSEAWEQSC